MTGRPALLPNWHTLFLKNPIDNTDLCSILKVLTMENKMKKIVDAYYSNELKCWVRLERMEDGEWCHTSGYDSKESACFS